MVENNVSEPVDLFTPQLALWVLLVGVLPASFALWVKIKPTVLIAISIGHRFLRIALSPLIILLVAVLFLQKLRVINTK
ncbi:MAG: phosphoethanolamine transferase domain-containing protein [Symbiopectobacterium sp.]